ncbi:MAG: alcohol dehydrogenase catalytic domain-containing protein [Persicimonas sp.]
MSEYGAPDVLDYVEDAPRPTCASNQVVLKVEASSINPLDCKTRRGDLRWMLRREFPRVLGNDASGTLVEVGDEVDDLSVGDQVFCMVDANTRRACNGFAMSGSYAEYVATRADTVSLKPERLSHPLFHPRGNRTLGILATCLNSSLMSRLCRPNRQTDRSTLFNGRKP